MSFIRQRSFTRISLRRKTSKDDGDGDGERNGKVKSVERINNNNNKSGKLAVGGEIYGKLTNGDVDNFVDDKPLKIKR